MQSTVVTVAAFALLPLGCLKPQPVTVEAPVVINIPPMPKTALTVDPPLASCWPRLTYITPRGWDVESRQKEAVTFRHHDIVGAVISAGVEEIYATESFENDAKEFHKEVLASLERRNIAGSTYLTSAGPNAEFVVVRFSSEMGCGTSAYMRLSEPPSRAIVVHGEWPCDADVEHDASMLAFMQSVRILTE